MADYSADPLAGLAARDGALAIITGIEGPSYRPLGARMAVFPGGDRIGTLSSGCIENDIAIHAMQAMQAGRPRAIRYGRGSPYGDITLPCGGGLDILLLPLPCRETLTAACDMIAARQPVTLGLHPDSGAVVLGDAERTGWYGGWFEARIRPEIFFYVFGKGPEASTFARLVQSAGYPNLLLSPDQETLGWAVEAGCATQHLKTPGFPDDLRPDRWSAVVLFFHDHEWEPPILAGALRSDAFYIGAQGSLRASQTRLAELQALDPTADLSRLRGPIGLVPSARDARTLAVSVLAEVLAESGAAGGRNG